MMIRQKSIFPKIFYCILFISTLYLSKNLAYGAFVSDVYPMSFGSIIADPLGDVVEIDASSGAAVPTVLTAGNAILTGGYSGRIRVYSDIPGQMISLVYPGSIVLSNGANTMTINGIMARSQFAATTTAIGSYDFYIGGLLFVALGQATNVYSGTMTVTVNIVNP